MPAASRPKAGLVLAGVLVVLVVHVAILWTIQEDAFIGFRFVRNLVAGHGLVWNVGEPPVEGYTNFLWLILLSGAMRAGLDVVVAAQVLGTAFAMGATVVTAVLARRLFPPPGYAWALPPLLLALSGSFAAWASSGMETSMFAFLVVLGVARDAGERDDARRWPLSAVVLALAAMTRPEGMLVFALVLAHRVACGPVRVRHRRALATWTLAFAVPFGAYFAWRYHYYGFLLPNTFYAKVGTTAEQVVRGAKYLGKFFIVMAVPALALPGFVLGRRDRLVSLAATITVAYLTYVVLVGGDYMALFRFMVPVLPLMALASPLSLQALRRRTAWPAGAWALVAAVVVVASILPSMNVEGLPTAPPPSGPYLKAHNPRHWYLKMRQVTALPRLLSERWYVNRFTLLGTWIARELPREAAVAYTGIGVIGYLCEQTVFDMYGLTDAHIAHVRAPRMGQGTAGHEKRDFLYLLQREPTYILYSRHFSPVRRVREELPALYGHELADLAPATQAAILRHLDRYAVDNVWLVDAPNQEAGYVTFLRLTRCATAEGCARCPACERGEIIASGRGG